MIKRDRYLNELIRSRKNGFPKVITGIRRCGKSYLLKEIYAKYLKDIGVKNENILIIELDDILNYKYRNPIRLMEYVQGLISHLSDDVYVFIDEIQLITKIINPELTGGEIKKAKETEEDTISFVDVVLGLSRIKNVDLYVTGSNSKLLSKDVATEFRDKATEIHMRPLSFKEFYEYLGGDERAAFNEYMRHGGMPLAVLSDYDNKEQYLKNLFELTYFKDILEYNKIRKSESLSEICDVLSFCSGQPLNSQKIVNILESRKKEKIGKEAVDRYIQCFENAYLIDEAKRYDIKGGDVIGATRKYYFEDVGLRNARLDFTSLDSGQVIENIVYNELIYNGYNVKVGTFNQVEKDKTGKSILKTYEVDFYATKGTKSIYIQVTDDITKASTKEREIRPYFLINDSIRKVIVINEPIKEMKLENGILLEGITDFLLNQM